MLQSALVLVLSACVYRTFGDSDLPTVTTKNGQLLGKVVTTSRGQCNAFLGVPFAEPPVGDLRFQKPHPIKGNWTGVRNATVSGPMCIQLGSSGQESDQSEDCLVLNIFVPTPAVKVPVMVYIHGGAFGIGSAKDYGEEGPCENLASRGVILVVIQYRLFIYGFFSTGDGQAPGNYALWDQIAALRWVKDNIASFGGDPDKVTVFGESAGGASVSYLTYTPVAKNLFHQSIASSGTIYAYWAFMSNASVVTGHKVAKAVNCSNSDSASNVECLRNISVAYLQRAYNSVPNILTDPFYLVWSFRADGEMFSSKKPEELRTKRPAIIGMNSMESPIPDAANISQGYEQLNLTLRYAIPNRNKTLHDVLDQTARYVYIDSKGDPEDERFVYEQAMKMQQDLGFHASATHEAMAKKAAGDPVWVYNFDYWSDNCFPAEYPFEKGSPHGHDLCYLFLHDGNVQLQASVTCPDNYDGDNRLVADYIGEMWTNFAKTGDPSPSSLHWPQFVNVNNACAMTIRANMSIEPHYFLEATNFWYKLYPSIQRDFDDDQNSGTSSMVQSWVRILVMISLLIAVGGFRHL